MKTMKVTIQANMPLIRIAGVTVVFIFPSSQNLRRYLKSQRNWEDRRKAYQTYGTFH